jgi:uncharacterized GH25 family protein
VIADVDVVSGEARNIGTVDLDSGAELVVVVRRALDDSPVPNATVMVTHAEPFLIQRAVTDTNGRLTLSGLEPGDWAVDVHAHGFMNPPTRATLLISNKINEISFLLQEGSVVEGNVVGPQAEPIAGATVTIHSMGQELRGGQATTDAAGKFSFSGIGEGNYLVTASHPSLGIATRSIRVADSTATPIALRLVPSSGARVHVISVLGNPITNCLVEIDIGEGLTLTERTDSNGQVSFENIAPGIYSLNMSATGFESTGALVSIAPTPEGSQFQFALEVEPEMATVLGLVTLADGETRLEDVSVAFWDGRELLLRPDSVTRTEKLEYLSR